ncbi:MAG: hypothetical protein AAGI66_08970 [Cyanobacteria bacterium P01_H01_bin.74]
MILKRTRHEKICFQYSTAMRLNWAATDMLWSIVEQDKGKYDFSNYDKLVSDLKQHGLKTVFILDLGIPRYGNGAPLGGNA